MKFRYLVGKHDAIHCIAGFHDEDDAYQYISVILARTDPDGVRADAYYIDDTEAGEVSPV